MKSSVEDLLGTFETSSEAICKLGTHLKTYRKLSGNSNHAEQRRTARDRPSEVTVVEGASPLMKGLSQFFHEIMNLGCEADISNLQPAVAQLITKDLKVEIHGKHINWTDDAKKKGLPSKFHTGKLVKMDDASGRYEVELDSIVWNAGTPQEKKYRDKFSAQNFRIL